MIRLSKSATTMLVERPPLPAARLLAKRVLLAASLLATLGFACPAARSASPIPVPPMSDFVGTWRIKRVVGASQGGLTGEDPKVVVGKVVRWTATDIQFPDGTCRLRQPAVTPLPNRVLERRLWLGQKLNDLSLSKAEITRGFGAEDTPVFQDEFGCASAVLIGRNHMVEMFGNGWIYWLKRVPSYPHGIRHTFAGCAKCVRR